MSHDFAEHLKAARLLHVQQVWEGFEIVLGWESRNKYRILDENMQPVAFAAEQSTGILGALLRQFLGHWRSFKVTIFNQQKQKVFELDFPFRWFFKTLYVKGTEGQILGYVQQRFAFFRKKFDVHDSQGQLIGKVNSSFFRFWTFEVEHHNRMLGKVQKKWSGILGEMFTDKDNFVVTYADPNINLETKSLILGLSLMADIVYFENNQGKGSLTGMFD